MCCTWDVDALAEAIPYRTLAEWDEYYSWKIESMYFADTMSKGDSNEVVTDIGQIDKILTGFANGGIKQS